MAGCEKSGRNVSFKTLAELALVILDAAAERRFSLQNNIKAATRSCLSEAKLLNLMTVFSAAISFEAFVYAQAAPCFTP